MAEIYQKIVGDQTLILGSRESVTRKFNLGTWTELLFGMYCAGTTTASGNATPPTENVTWHSVTDNIYIGLRNSSSTALPGVAGAQFIGMVPRNYASAGAESANSNGSQYGTASGQMLAISEKDASVLAGGTYPAYSMGPGPSFTTPTAASAYNGFFGMRFVVSNAGLGSQTIAIQSVVSASEAGTNYSVANLQSRLLGVGAWGTSFSLAWNSGGAALPLPDAIYIYMPFYNCRIRISALDVIKVS